MATISYFAYGSNMLIERLKRRCPSAKVRGVAIIRDWTLNFSKQSRHGCGMATIEHAPGGQVFGVVFDLEEREQPMLDRAEGLGHGYYRDDSFLVQMHGSEETSCTFTYIADAAYKNPTLMPFDWYLRLVLAGARQNALPAEYVHNIEATRPMRDPKLDRPERLAVHALLNDCTFDI